MLESSMSEHAVLLFLIIKLLYPLMLVWMLILFEMLEVFTVIVLHWEVLKFFNLS